MDYSSFDNLFSDLNDSSKVNQGIKICFEQNAPDLAWLLAQTINQESPDLNNERLQLLSFSETKPFEEKQSKQPTKIYRIKLLCNWTTSEDLCKTWNKMSKGNYTWENLQITWENDNIDYWVIINRPLTEEKFDPKRTVIFHMEPYIARDVHLWGGWSQPNKSLYYKVCDHETEHNNVEWHLSKTYQQLMFEKIEKNGKNKVISTILSPKYADPGQKKRIDFVRF